MEEGEGRVDRRAMLEWKEAAENRAIERDARFDAPRADVEALIEAAEAYRMAAGHRVYELENGDDWLYEGDREQDLDAAEIVLCAALSRLTQSPPRASGDGREED